MRLHEALEKYKKVRRSGWIDKHYYYEHDPDNCSVYLLDPNRKPIRLLVSEIIEDDWEAFVAEVELLPCPICGNKPTICCEGNNLYRAVCYVGEEAVWPHRVMTQLYSSEAVVRSEWNTLVNRHTTKMLCIEQ
jgi:hypothetical protein